MGARTSREHLLPRRVRIRVQRRILGMPRGRQAPPGKLPQDERGRVRQGLQGISDPLLASPLLSFAQRFCREIIAWKHLSHPNILPLLGVSVSANSHYFRILTKWMPNGNVIQYAVSNPKANRLQLVGSLSRFAGFLLFIPIFSSPRSCQVWSTFTSSGLFMGISKG